jgi:REP element-mobilizing transposase RayT
MATWGGKREGAGRKRVASRPLTPHRARLPHTSSHPVQVTLQALFRPLHSEEILPTLRRAIAAANRRAPERFRVIQYSVGHNQMHLLVEAIDQQALSSGMSSLAIRIARSVNALVGRRGRFWADRWHGRTLTSSRQVEAALGHLLTNDSHRTSFSADSAGGVVLPRSHSSLWQIVRRALEQRS